MNLGGLTYENFPNNNKLCVLLLQNVLRNPPVELSELFRKSEGETLLGRYGAEYHEEAQDLVERYNKAKGVASAMVDSNRADLQKLADGFRDKRDVKTLVQPDGLVPVLTANILSAYDNALGAGVRVPFDQFVKGLGLSL